VGVDQGQIQTESGGDTRIEEAIEVGTQDPGGVHSDAAVGPRRARAAASEGSSGRRPYAGGLAIVPALRVSNALASAMASSAFLNPVDE
jgi:hypothetical protein